MSTSSLTVMRKRGAGDVEAALGRCVAGWLRMGLTDYHVVLSSAGASVHIDLQTN